MTYTMQTSKFSYTNFCSSENLHVVYMSPKCQIVYEIPNWGVSRSLGWDSYIYVRRPGITKIFKLKEKL